jgi:hypothetical protein
MYRTPLDTAVPVQIELDFLSKQYLLYYPHPREVFVPQQEIRQSYIQVLVIKAIIFARIC